MSEVPPPLLREPSPWMREVGLTIVKGIIYSLIFWAVYRAVYQWGQAKPSPAEDGAYKDQVKAYEKQQTLTNKILADQEALVARSKVMLDQQEAVITKQQQQAVRLDAVLDRWERQTGIRKEAR